MRTGTLFKGTLLIVLVVMITSMIILKPDSKIVQVANVVEAAQTFSSTSVVVVPIKKVNTVIPNKVVSTIPVRLKIPSIGVDAHIESLGLTKAGAMDAPVGPKNAAWYNLGPKPGQIGSAVMDGHFGWKGNIPAVFDNLSKLKKGDKIQTIDEGGRVTTFIVRETKVLANDADATTVFTSSDGKAHLNLITCYGTWDTATKNRPNRLVVFADKAV